MSDTPIGEVQTDAVVSRNVLKLYVAPKKDNRDHDVVMLEFTDLQFSDRFLPICLPM